MAFASIDRIACGARNALAIALIPFLILYGVSSYLILMIRLSSQLIVSIDLKQFLFFYTIKKTPTSSLLESLQKASQICSKAFDSLRVNSKKYTFFRSSSHTHTHTHTDKLPTCDNEKARQICTYVYVSFDSFSVRLFQFHILKFLKKNEDMRVYP